MIESEILLLEDTMKQAHLFIYENISESSSGLQNRRHMDFLRLSLLETTELAREFCTTCEKALVLFNYRKGR